MHVLHTKTPEELAQSILAEIAKAKNEIKCARQDLEKATSRLTFSIAAVNELLNRLGD